MTLPSTHITDCLVKHVNFLVKNIEVKKTKEGGPKLKQINGVKTILINNAEVKSDTETEKSRIIFLSRSTEYDQHKYNFHVPKKSHQKYKRVFETLKTEIDKQLDDQENNMERRWYTPFTGEEYLKIKANDNTDMLLYHGKLYDNIEDQIEKFSPIKIFAACKPYLMVLKDDSDEEFICYGVSFGNCSYKVTEEPNTVVDDPEPRKKKQRMTSEEAFELMGDS